jgi:uncharacterized SAM-binding protein YcdF (DUF218 family)
MSTAETKSDDGAGERPDPAGSARPAPGRWLLWIGRTTVIVLVLAAALLGLGFLWFISSVPNEEVALTRDADGIVVLTGGASRVNDAMELMAAGRGKRLLISGLNRSTRIDEVLRLNPEFARVVSCCVDFDRSLNTLGNAVETKRWAENRGFRTLIVVTSNYHMPRALAEISHQIPNAVLVPFPVVTDKQRAEPWWKTAASARLMISEYVKYVYARLRMNLHPEAKPDELAMLAERLRAK